jgi:urea transporter
MGLCVCVGVCVCSAAALATVTAVLSAYFSTNYVQIADAHSIEKGIESFTPLHN